MTAARSWGPAVDPILVVDELRRRAREIRFRARQARRDRCPFYAADLQALAAKLDRQADAALESEGRALGYDRGDMLTGDHTGGTDVRRAEVFRCEMSSGEPSARPSAGGGERAG